MAEEHKPYRYKHGWIPIDPIRESDLSSGDARRSRLVSGDEFQSVARRGAAKYGALKAAGSEPGALKGGSWDRVKGHAFATSRDPWGGTTVDAHSGEEVRKDADAYAVTVRDKGMPTVSVDPKAGRDEFDAAMETAKRRYAHILRRKDHHLGVFHDADLGRIDIDPVVVVQRRKDAEEIGAFTHAVGGAYHFKSGNGYWPPHVKG